MKKIGLLFIAIAALCSNLFSQNFRTEEDVYKYLKANMTTMDKVEGLYKYASYTQKNNDEPVRVPVAPSNVAIVAAGPDVYNAYWVGANHMVNPKSFMQLKKLDYLKKYEATFYGGEAKEVEFMEDFAFRVYKEKSKKDADGSTVSNIYYLERLFPAKADIEAERARLEAANPKFGKCTGFMIGNNVIVTNLSVIEKAKAIRIKGIKGDLNKSYTCVVRQTDKTNDLAILAIEDPTVVVNCPVALNSIQPEVGNDVYVLGYPLAPGSATEVKLTKGIVSSKSGYEGDVASYQINATVQKGNYGSPVFDKKGALIGVISSKNAGTENAGYCIKPLYVKSLLETLPTKVKLPATNVLAAKPLPEKVKTLSKYVYLLEVDY